MDGHQLDTAIAAGLSVGKGGELVEGGVEGRAEQVLLAAGQLVKTAPQQVEVGARGRVHAGVAAQPQPDLLEPGSQGRGWLG